MSSLPLSNFPVMDDEAAVPEATTSDKMISVLVVWFEGRRGATCRNDLSESRRNNAIFYPKNEEEKTTAGETEKLNRLYFSSPLLPSLQPICELSPARSARLHRAEV